MPWRLPGCLGWLSAWSGGDPGSESYADDVITYLDRGPQALAAEGRWAELLRYFRQGRVAGGGAGPVGHLIAYGAPPELAARLFDADGGPGSAAGVGDHDAGPLWEVLATRHCWRRLAPLLEPREVRRLVAHTRILLGEDLAGVVEPDEEGVPAVLQSWEPVGRDVAGPVREYLPGGGARRALLAVPATREGLGPVTLPPLGPAAARDGRPAADPVADLAATRLLAGLADWVAVACVRGPASDAAARLAGGGAVTAGYVPFAAVYPALVQLASSRPGQGAAEGRLAVWRLLAAMTGEPRVAVRPIEQLVARLRCFTWCEGSDELWYVHLALEDPATGLAWALSGTRDV